MRIGVIGCGDIARKAYLPQSRRFPALEVVAVADLDAARAKALADEHGLRAQSVDDLIAADDIDCVLNLTIPAAHHAVALRAIEAGKHVYSEKPFALTPEQGREVLAAAEAKGVRVGNAPDTFLGTAHQACRKLLDDGVIGRPLHAIALMLSPGHESWHPAPQFYYQPGGGPMLDMGPYYLAALVNMLGPIDRVAGETAVMITPRVARHDNVKGLEMAVETPDHVAGTVRFADGPVATIVTSFAARHGKDFGSGQITVFGTEGTLIAPDPNHFDRPVRYRRTEDDDWTEATPQHTHPNGRSLGVADLALALRDDRPHRASGHLAQAVLESMVGFLTSAETGAHVPITTPHTRPAMMPLTPEVA